MAFASVSLLQVAPESKNPLVTVSNVQWKLVYDLSLRIADSFKEQVQVNYDDAVFQLQLLNNLGYDPRITESAGILFFQSSFWESYVETLLERSFGCEVLFPEQCQLARNN